LKLVINSCLTIYGVAYDPTSPPPTGCAAINHLQYVVDLFTLVRCISGAKAAIIRIHFLRFFILRIRTKNRNRHTKISNIWLLYGTMTRNMAVLYQVYRLLSGVPILLFTFQHK